jgi:hypothetical protein
VIRALMGTSTSSGTSKAKPCWCGGSSPLETSTTTGCRGKEPIIFKKKGKVIQTWLATGTSGLGEDGAASFRIFLMRTFLVLARARGATASEDRFRLGVSLAVLGWICIMLFEGGGAFLPKKTTGATGKKQKGDPSSFIGSGPFSCCRNKE